MQNLSVSDNNMILSCIHEEPDRVDSKIRMIERVHQNLRNNRRVELKRTNKMSEVARKLSDRLIARPEIGMNLVLLLVVSSSCAALHDDQITTQDKNAAQSNLPVPGRSEVLIATLASDGAFGADTGQKSVNSSAAAAPVPYYTLSEEVLAQDSNKSSVDDANSNKSKLDGGQAIAEQTAGDDLNLELVNTAQDRLHAVASLLNAASISDDGAPADVGPPDLAARTSERSGFTSIESGSGE